MPQEWKELGHALKQLRISWDLAQKEVINRLSETIGERTLRAYESGAQRPSRSRLLKLLTQSFELRDAGQLNRYLGLAGYGVLSESEIQKLELTTETEAPLGCERYVHPAGYFQKEGRVWNEYHRSKPEPVFTFTELRRDADYIYLFDASRSQDPGRPMYLRIPLCGGVAQWTYPNPMQWEDVLIVEPALG
jgi:hypothetical protein